MAFKTVDLGIELPIAVQRKVAPARTFLIQRKILRIRLELDTGRRGCQDPHAPVDAVQLLVDMAAQNRLHLRITANHLPKRLTVVELVLIEPGTTRRQRMMVQQNQRMAVRMGRQGLIEQIQLLPAQFAVGNPLYLAIEQDHLPMLASQHLVAWLDLWRRQHRLHARLVVVVARQPEAWLRPARDPLAKALVGVFSMVLGNVARCHNGIKRARSCIYRIQHGMKAIFCRDAQQTAAIIGKKVGIGNLQKNHTIAVRLWQSKVLQNVKNLVYLILLTNRLSADPVF